VVELLAINAGRLVTQSQLLERVWGLRDTRNNYVRVFLAAIRRKLEPDPAHPRYFITEPRSGVRFDPAPPPARVGPSPQPSERRGLASPAR
jgi:two-component system KDP operon response regulator KdpE